MCWHVDKCADMCVEMCVAICVAMCVDMLLTCVLTRQKELLPGARVEHPSRGGGFIVEVSPNDASAKPCTPAITIYVP